MMMMRREREMMMSRVAVLFAVPLVGSAIDAALGGAAVAGKIRLAQSSNVTNCMMTCNSQAATRVTTCISPGATPTGAATTTSNANLNTACQVNCSTQRLQC
jgi:hypothetical protein